jgi:glycosyltransferase involved in cell wall biosynthesis
MDKSNISLLIPCFNSEKSIALLLNEALAQSVPFYEIICYDDGSTDQTAAIIGSFKQVQLIGDRQNRGPSYARNRLAEKAQGTFIHFHDADDSLAFTFVEHFMSNLNEEAVTYCNMKMTSYGQKTGYSKRLEANSHEELIATLIDKFIHLNRCVFPRNSFLRLGGFDESFQLCEDKLLHLELAISGMSYQYIDHILVHRVKHLDSLVSQRPWNEKVFALVRMYEKIQGDLPKIIHSSIGGKLLVISWDLYYRGFPDQSYKTIEVASAYGINSWKFSKRTINYVSSIMGIKLFFWFRKLSASISGRNNIPKEYLKDRDLVNPVFERQNFS